MFEAYLSVEDGSWSQVSLSIRPLMLTETNPGLHGLKAAVVTKECEGDPDSQCKYSVESS